MQSNQGEISSLDFFDDLAGGFVGQFDLPDVSPPNENLAVVEVAFRESLLRVIEFDAANDQSFFGLQVFGNFVSQEI